jgi:hypothetical protein
MKKMALIPCIALLAFVGCTPKAAEAPAPEPIAPAAVAPAPAAEPVAEPAPAPTEQPAVNP